MATFLATHDPFLQSTAQLLVLPMSADGTILNPVLARTKSLYPSNYDCYRKAAIDGTLVLGEVLLHKCEKHIIGLGSPNNHTADYIANLISTNHAHHASELSTLTTAFNHLNGQLFELVRYKGLRQIAIFATPLFIAPTGNPEFVKPASHRPISPAQFWQLLQKQLDLPRVRIMVHFGKEIEIDEFTAQKITPSDVLMPNTSLPH